MEPEPEPEPDPPSSDEDEGSQSSGGGWEDEFETEEEQAAIAAAATAAAEAEAKAQAEVEAAENKGQQAQQVRKQKGRGARRYDMGESGYVLGEDHLTGSAGEPAELSRRQPHVLVVITTAAGMMEPEQCNMLVLRELEDVARECASDGVDTTVQIQWLPAGSGGGALAVFQTAAAANVVMRKAASSSFRLVAYADASQAARSIPIERLAPTARRTTGTAASRMVTSALGLPKAGSTGAAARTASGSGRGTSATEEWEWQLRLEARTSAPAPPPPVSPADDVW